MDTEQPYRPPQANLTAPSAEAGSGQITSGMIHQLDRTRPWVRFIGVLMIIGCVFLVLMGVMVMLMGGFFGMDQSLGPSFGILIGVVYLLMAFLYFFPARYLLRYGAAIKQMRGGTNTRAVEEALGHQASFWRFVGILAAAILALYGLALVLVLIGAVVGALVG